MTEAEKALKAIKSVQCAGDALTVLDEHEETIRKALQGVDASDQYAKFQQRVINENVQARIDATEELRMLNIKTKLLVKFMQHIVDEDLGRCSVMCADALKNFNSDETGVGL